MRGIDNRTISDNLKLVAKSMIKAPKELIPLRRAMDIDEPIIDCNKVVSEVKRDMMSPLRLVSKNAGCKVIT